MGMSIMSELPPRLKKNMDQWGQDGGKTESKEAGIEIVEYINSKEKTWFGTKTIKNGTSMEKGYFQKGMTYLHQRNLIERWGGPDSAIRLTDKGKQDPGVWDDI